MRRVAIDLLLRLAAALLAVGAAAGAVVTVAALAEGHLPRPTTLRHIVLPLAAFLGGAWTLAAWRAEGADMALANTGRPPALGVIVVAVAAAVVLALGTETTAVQRPAWDLSLAPNALVVETADATHRYRWDATGALREADGARFEGLPAPGVQVAAHTGTDRTPTLVAIRCALLLLVLGWLGHRVEPPGLALTFGSAGGAFALAHLASAWVA